MSSIAVSSPLSSSRQHYEIDECLEDTGKIITSAKEVMFFARVCLSVC